jgi:hypothetical protein
VIDVLGLTLTEASELLSAEHLDYEVLETAPSGRQVPDGELRVLRQTTSGEGRVLLVVGRAVRERFSTK